eukprot:s1102_g20.t1
MIPPVTRLICKAVPCCATGHVFLVHASLICFGCLHIQKEAADLALEGLEDLEESMRRIGIDPYPSHQTPPLWPVLRQSALLRIIPAKGSRWQETSMLHMLST